ncbi:unnamed protein product, partial [Phaeothamnion confervicola]
MVEGGEKEEGRLPWFIDPSTRGGAVIVPFASLIFPIGGWYALASTGMDGLVAGNYVTAAYVLVVTVAWTGSYFFRVATKNMTYAQQV